MAHRPIRFICFVTGILLALFFLSHSRVAGQVDRRPLEQRVTDLENTVMDLKKRIEALESLLKIRQPRAGSPAPQSALGVTGQPPQVGDSLVLLFSKTGEEILSASFEIDRPGNFTVIITDLAIRIPSIPFDFFADGAPFQENLRPDEHGSILLPNVPGNKRINFNVDVF